MKSSIIISVLVTASITTAIYLPDNVAINQQTQLSSDELFLIELTPGETRWVTEDEKWQLRLLGQNFFDVSQPRLIVEMQY